MLLMKDLDLTARRVLIREDFNVPVQDGHITSTTRIDAALPTIRQALQRKAAVILVSHLGRPRAGVGCAGQPQFSLQPVASYLSKVLQRPVPVIENWRNGSTDTAHARVAPAPGEMILLENIRFIKGETDNDPKLAAELASLADIFIMDAFAVAHRAHASTSGVAEAAPQACAGPLLSTELQALDTLVKNPERPLVVIVGGAKISSKINLLSNFRTRADHLVVGGALSNTLLLAAGYPIGKSMHEPDLASLAGELVAGDRLVLPVDLVVATDLSAPQSARIALPGEVAASEAIYDVGPATRALHRKLVGTARTIIWNGPMGAFEHPAFRPGTTALAQAIAASPAFSAVGGGDTISALEKTGLKEGISCISTGGGAFLEYIEGSDLPGIKALRAAHDHHQAQRQNR